MKNHLLQYKQFLLYCAIGSCGIALTLLTFAGLVKFTSFHYQLANAIGYSAGTILSFFLNSRYNFQVTDDPFRRFTIFFAIALAGLSVSAALLKVLVGHYQLNIYLTYLIVIFVVVLLQYNLNRLISFKK